MATPKSILKKVAATADPPTSLERKPATKTRDERNREIALYHANLIQDQKDVEAAILEAIETLIDFPASPSSTASMPESGDIDQFTRLIYIFTPSDYDDLVEERRIDQRCGYVFCSNAPKATAGGKMKIVGGLTKNAKLMDRKKAEAYCSNACAKRSLFVKVQLLDTVAWERRGQATPSIEILKDDEERQLEARKQVGVDEAERKMKDLALERGDQDKPARAVNMICEDVVERENVAAPTAPVRKQDEDDMIEGYVVRGKDGEKLELASRELNI